MSDAVDALKQFCRDVASGAYPEVLDALRVRSGTEMNKSTYQPIYCALFVDLWRQKGQAHRFPHITVSSDSISIGTKTAQNKQAKHCIKINDDEFAAFLRSINWADSIAHLNRKNPRSRRTLGLF